jgi:hypothetical protein
MTLPAQGVQINLGCATVSSRACLGPDQLSLLGVPILGLMDIEFGPQHPHVVRSLDPKANPIPLDPHHRDLDVVTNTDALSMFST